MIGKFSQILKSKWLFSSLTLWSSKNIKIHKTEVPLRKILRMINSPTYRLSKFVNQLLQPVRDAVSSKTVTDSFDFIQRIRAMDLSNSFLCSFGVVSLFTNVPLEEAISFIKLTCDQLKIQLPIEFEFLKSLILLCIHNIQFSFDNTLYFLRDGVAMGSPLAPTLADIFVGYLETFVIKTCEFSPTHYFRFVDDTLAVFASPSHVQPFLESLNNLHTNLRFACETESSNRIAFLDVLVHKTDSLPQTSVHRKPTWTGLYLHFLSFVPISYKRNLVRNLFHRALKISSPEFLEAERTLLHKTLQENGYPLRFIERHSQIRPHEDPIFGPEKKPVFLCVPFLGDRQASFMK